LASSCFHYSGVCIPLIFPITKNENLSFDCFQSLTAKTITAPHGRLGKFRQKKPAGLRLEIRRLKLRTYSRYATHHHRVTTARHASLLIVRARSTSASRGIQIKGKTMSKNDVIRAWKDPKYRKTLSAVDQASMPVNPVGALELTDEELDGVAGGLPKYTVGTNCFSVRASCDCSTAWPRGLPC